MNTKQTLLVAFTVMGMTGCSNNFNRYNYDAPNRTTEVRTENDNRNREREREEIKKEPPIQPKLVGVCPAYVAPKLPAVPQVPRVQLERAKKQTDAEMAALESKNVTDAKQYAAERERINRIYDAIEKDYIITLRRHAETVQRLTAQAEATYRAECDKWIKAQKFVKEARDD